MAESKLKKENIDKCPGFEEKKEDYQEWRETGRYWAEGTEFLGVREGPYGRMYWKLTPNRRGKGGSGGVGVERARLAVKVSKIWSIKRVKVG